VRFLVTFALEEEFGRWRRRGGFEPDGSLSEVRAYQRRQGDIEVSTVLTSVGTQSAARTVARVLEASAFDLVISSGFAGGLRQRHRPGHVLVGRSVRQLIEDREVKPPEKWLARARVLGAEEATFVTSPTAVATREEKRRLASEADAVEMESFAIVEQAQARGVPGIVIRAISDPAEMELLIDFDRVLDAGGRVRAAPLAAQLLRKPAAVAGLARLARESRRASASLAEFLERFVAVEAATGTEEE
jgi:adenosylhomocysteine nucleosidase